MTLLTEQFEADFRNVGEARRAVVRTLRAHVLPSLLDDVSIVVSELATNAVLHARTSFTVAVAVGRGRLRVSVFDGSAVLPRVRRFSDADSSTGRGLQMVSLLSAAWGVAPTENGKQTWCEFVLPVGDPLGDEQRREEQAGTRGVPA